MSERRFPWAIRAGELVRYEELTIHAESLAMRYALSAFEGVRGYLQRDGRTVRYFALAEHLERLGRTLAAVRLPAPPLEEVTKAAARLLVENEVHEDCYLRIAANATSLGTLRAKGQAEYFVSVQPMGRKPWLEKGLSLSVTLGTRRKPADEVFPQHAKVISNYAGPRLAFLDAKDNGFDEVVLESADGHLAEAPTANLFLVHGGKVLTPRLEDSILPGITRATVLSLCRAMGIETEERALSREDAYAADEAFLCGTGLELGPIGAFDNRPLPAARAIFPRLVERYFDLVRDLPAPEQSA